jgi:glycine/D-amino acid oxidase-like deaminating enzyme
MRQETYDAIVVGSGITGGWAAKELAEAGLNTLRRARACVEPPLSRTRRSEISRAAKASTTDVLCLR